MLFAIVENKQSTSALHQLKKLPFFPFLKEISKNQREKKKSFQSTTGLFFQIILPINILTNTNKGAGDSKPLTRALGNQSFLTSVQTILSVHVGVSQMLFISLQPSQESAHCHSFFSCLENSIMFLKGWSETQCCNPHPLQN